MDSTVDRQTDRHGSIDTWKDEELSRISTDHGPQSRHFPPHKRGRGKSEPTPLQRIALSQLRDSLSPNGGSGPLGSPVTNSSHRGRTIVNWPPRHVVFATMATCQQRGAVFCRNRFFNSLSQACPAWIVRGNPWGQVAFNGHDEILIISGGARRDGASFRSFSSSCLVSPWSSSGG